MVVYLDSVQMARHTVLRKPGLEALWLSDCAAKGLPICCLPINLLRINLKLPHHLPLPSTMASDAPTELPSETVAPTSLPANAFDFLPDLHALLQRVFNDELDPKDVAHESSRIRLKMERARVMVSELPDVDRSLDEQKKEIRELEEKIEQQRGIMRAISKMEVVTEIAARVGGEKMEIDP